MLCSRRLLAPLVCLILALGSFAASPAFQPDLYLKHIKFLASDELQGRGNGTPELDRAAEYIAKEFEASGLQPAGDMGGYFQKFMITTGSQLGPGNKLTFKIGGKTLEATLYRDFVPIAVGEKVNVSGELVFAGYGITAEEYAYDDYKGLDVTDKIVLVLAHEPRENDPNSTFNGKETTLHGHDNTKIANAKYRGARGMLIVHDPANHEDPTKDLPDPSLVSQVDELGLCAIRITRDLAERLLAAQDTHLLELQKQIDEKMTPQSFGLQGEQAQIDMDVTRIRKEVRNVVGLLPGTDPSVAEESIVLGAHYDHLGRGGRSSLSPQLVGQIHNGADDNASGTAGLLELAAALARDPTPRKRSYLFIAFAGEEQGLRGSDYWANHPTRPIEKEIAMINIDMIGRCRNNQVFLSGTGTSPVFPEIVQIAASEAGLEVKISRSGYGASDHLSFYLKNVPVLFFFSGLHADYHRPSDDWDKIDGAAATKILSMVLGVATRLNGVSARPQFTKVDEPMVSGNTRGGPSYGAYFGSVPDMGADVKGVRFADIRPESPAAKAGLRGQDILIKFAGKDITSLEDFTYMLRTHKPGERVEVVVLRDGKPMTAEVTLGVRR